MECSLSNGNTVTYNSNSTFHISPILITTQIHIKKEYSNAAETVIARMDDVGLDVL